MRVENVKEHIMKKLLIPVLLLCTVVMLSGCGQKEEPIAPEDYDEPMVEEVDETIMEEPVSEENEQEAPSEEEVTVEETSVSR